MIECNIETKFNVVFDDGKKLTFSASGKRIKHLHNIKGPKDYIALTLFGSFFEYLSEKTKNDIIKQLEEVAYEEVTRLTEGE